MKKVQIHQVDAFTDRLFGGNPAGVVFEGDGLTDEEMKDIAREMNLSETAFVLTPTRKGADFKLRYFTSGKAEIKFCGHATIGSLYEIGRIGLFGTEKLGSYRFNIETNAGILPMTIVKKSKRDISVRFTAPEVQLEDYKSQHVVFAERLGIPLEVMNRKCPVMIDRNLNYVYLAINSLRALGELEFNFGQIIDNFKKEGIVIFCLLTVETFDKKNQVHVRGLAPLVGVPEDPFTGSMQAGIGRYVLLNNLLAKSQKQIGVEQGHFIGRPGFAVIDLPSKSNSSFVISGKGVHVFSGEIEFLASLSSSSNSMHCGI